MKYRSLKMRKFAKIVKKLVERFRKILHERFRMKNMPRLLKADHKCSRMNISEHCFILFRRNATELMANVFLVLFCRLSVERQNNRCRMLFSIIKAIQES